MKVFYSSIQKKHVILYEIQYGKRHKYNDKGTRIDSILKQLRKSGGFDIVSPELLPYNALLAVHDDDYLKFLESSQNLNNVLDSFFSTRFTKSDLNFTNLF